jgi:hypothetical protein
MRHYQWCNQFFPDSKRSVPCMWFNRFQNEVNSLINRLIMVHGRQVPVQNKSQISYPWHHLCRIRTNKQSRLRVIIPSLDKRVKALLSTGGLCTNLFAGLQEKYLTTLKMIKNVYYNTDNILNSFSDMKKFENVKKKM